MPVSKQKAKRRAVMKDRRKKVREEVKRRTHRLETELQYYKNQVDHLYTMLQKEREAKNEIKEGPGLLEFLEEE